MIKIEHIVTASPEQMQFIIEGMRNPKNSWDRSDSEMVDYDICPQFFKLGKNDLDLMDRLAKAGPVHRKYMRMMPVYARITAPLYWWKEFDTYKVGTVRNSCSTMHKIQAKEFDISDFSVEHLYGNGSYADIAMKAIVDALNNYRSFYVKSVGTEGAKDIWWQMIQLLPSSYNQTANVMMNYETLANMYEWRKDHKLDEWRDFCEWIKTLPYSELITGGEV